MYNGIYLVNRRVTTSTAITVIQILAGTAAPIEVLRAWTNQSDSATSAETGIQLIRKSAAATVTAFTPLLVVPGQSAAAAVGGVAATGITATAEGTNTDILVDEGFNVLNGWLYLPVPEERIVMDGAGILGLLFPVAPASALYESGIIFRELG